jgi:hypothetical protein
MALINCPECGKEISSMEKTCPNCGCSIVGNTTENKQTDNRCPDCGAILPPNATVCSQCGCQLNKQGGSHKFTSQNLIQGEKILCSAKWHWINYVLFGILGLLSVVFFMLGIKEVNGWYEGLAWGVYFPSSVIFALFFVYGIASLLDNEFVVTNMRIFIKCGIIMRASYELRLEMLESIQVYQGIFGRIFGYGTILVHGIGASRRIVMRLESPLEFRQHIFMELRKENN